GAAERLSRQRAISWMGFSRYGRRQWRADRKLECSQCVVRGAEGVDVLAFRGKERSLGDEKVERGGPSQAIADGGDAKDLARLREEMVADEDGLAQRRRRIRVRGLHVETHLRPDVGDVGGEHFLAMQRTGHLAALMLPEENRQ